MLDLAIVWHHHQPSYKDPDNDEIILPWVRLHTVKDYWYMISMIDSFPSIKLNFNFTPILIEQILEYQQRKDNFELLTLKKANELSEDEKIEILKYFFLVPLKTIIQPNQRYFELFEKRGINFDPSNYNETLRKFQNIDFLDLQVLANLVWIDPISRENKMVSELFEKRRNYTESDKGILLDFMHGILNQVLVKYRQAVEAGKIEIMTSPLNHPILPLLCDSAITAIANSRARVPDWNFSYPEDALTQINRGLEIFERVFGQRPNGCWSPEMAVSQESVELLAKTGLKWTIADEKVLAKSLEINWQRDGSGILKNGEKLYDSYQMNFDNNSFQIMFRDAYLSDLIGFQYKNWDGKLAAEDLINRIRTINSRLLSDKNHLLVVALDGENAWEGYKNNGFDFLSHLYELLSEESGLRTVKISDYLKQGKDFPKLKTLAPGSWANGNFDIWAGSVEDAKAWKMLVQARIDLLEQEKSVGKKFEKAWQEIYAAESSDWYWWFGEEFHSELSGTFDLLFRKHLIKVYQIIDRPCPNLLFEPINKTTKKYSLTTRSYIKPVIDGKETNFYEWANAGFFDLTLRFGTMHKSSNFLKNVFFGFDDDNFYLRIGPDLKPDSIRIDFIDFPAAVVIAKNEAFFIQADVKIQLVTAYELLCELKIPKNLLPKTITQIQMVIRLFEGKTEVDISPVLTIDILDERSNAKFWQA